MHTIWNPCVSFSLNNHQCQFNVRSRSFERCKSLNGAKLTASFKLTKLREGDGEEKGERRKRERERRRTCDGECCDGEVCDGEVEEDCPTPPPGEAGNNPLNRMQKKL